MSDPSEESVTTTTHEEKLEVDYDKLGERSRVRPGEVRGETLKGHGKIIKG